VSTIIFNYFRAFRPPSQPDANINEKEMLALIGSNMPIETQKKRGIGVPLLTPRKSTQRGIFKKYPFPGIDLIPARGGVPDVCS
jgi:hypothetical protein